jgi:hypothetical protein
MKAGAKVQVNCKQCGGLMEKRVQSSGNMRTISILLVAFFLSAIADAQGEPDALSTLLDKNEKAVADYKAGKQNDSVTGLMAAASGADLDNDGAFQHCSVLIGYFSGLPMWRDTGIPMARVENTLDNIIDGDPHWTPPTQADLDAWRSAVAATPQDIADWNTAIKSIYHSKVTEKQIDKVLRKYCSNYTKHVFRASDLTNLVSKSQHKKPRQSSANGSSATASTQGESVYDEDYEVQRCSVVIYELSVIPDWRGGGLVVPFARAKETLVEQIVADPIVGIPKTQAGLDAWRSVVAATPQDIADWNAVVESIYNSKITGKQIDKALRKYCTPHTKHVFRASDLTNLVSKSQK